MFLNKSNHELLSYLVCGVHHFRYLEDFRIALRNNTFWMSLESESTTRISITIFHSVVSRILHEGLKLLSGILRDLQYIKPK